LAERCAAYRNGCVLPAAHPLLALAPTATPPRCERQSNCGDAAHGQDENSEPNGGESRAEADAGEDTPSADALAAAETPGLEPNAVCLQWRDCDPGEGVDASDGDGDGAGNLRGAVQGFLLLGQTGDESFASSRRLVRVGPLPAAASQSLQTRAARFRYALQRAADDGVSALPAAVARGFELLLCDVYRLLFPNAANAFVLRGEAKLSDGTLCGAACDVATLRFVEAFLNYKAGGAARQDPNLCAWWRDAADPIADGSADGTANKTMFANASSKSGSK
jgi:hypothetical protein